MGQVPKTIIITTLLVGLFLVMVAEADPDGAEEVIWICNPYSWGANEPYEDAVDDALTNLVDKTPKLADKYQYLSASSSETPLYAYASCDQSLTPVDCFGCLEDAVTFMLGKCVSSIGAQVIMVHCAIRYEDYPFYF